MFDLNVLGKVEPCTIYLCSPDGRAVYDLCDKIDQTSVSLTIGLNQQYTLSFEVEYRIDEFKYADYLQDGMYLFVAPIGFFRIKQTNRQLNGLVETRNIDAAGCDCELEDKNLELSINMGLETSMEYLVEYGKNESELLVNPYTNIPYDFIFLYDTRADQLRNYLNKYSNTATITKKSSIADIQSICNLIPRLKSKVDSNGQLTEYVQYTYDSNGNITKIKLSSFNTRINQLISFYDKYRKQLSVLDIVLEKLGGGWSVGNIYGLSDGDYSVANIKVQFDVNENIYSFLTSSLASAAQCLITFNIADRKINITPVDEVGVDSGIVMTYDRLINSLNISRNNASMYTRYNVQGSDGIDIAQINFGSTVIDDLSYFINAKDDDGNRIYVDDNFAEKYELYAKDREKARTAYIEYSEQYNKLLLEIDEIKYKVPSDLLSTDWGTFTETELQEQLVAFKNSLAALIALYKEDYGEAGVNADGSVNQSVMESSIYWDDYVSYQNLKDQVEIALGAKQAGEAYKDIQDEDLLIAINAWKTNWKLYGSVELENRVTSYENTLKMLVKSGAVVLANPNAQYYDDRILTWNQLSSPQKAEFFDEGAYKYDEYQEIKALKDAAKLYLNSLVNRINTLQARQQQAQQDRAALTKLIQPSNYNRSQLASFVLNMDTASWNEFSEADLKLIDRLYIDADYSNEYIISTSLEDIYTNLDVAQELLLDAQEHLSTMCRPQLTFAVESENLLGLEEFAPLWNEFKCGNYILVQYKDNIFARLRITGYTVNPMIPDSNSITITFSNYIRSKTMVSDLESLLGESSGGRVASLSGGTSGGGAGTLDETNLTNTMLNKLLSSETFGTAVSNVILDTIDVNAITAKNATFGDLYNGNTIINGKAIQTGYIADKTYNGVNGSINNTSGTIINLENGKFNFAGGALVYDGNELIIGGYAKTEDIKNTITGVNVLYAQNQSRTESPNKDDLSLWFDMAPSWQSGYYIWQMTQTIMQDGSATYSDPVCISGRDGVDGTGGSSEGVANYTWVKYADTSSGSGMSDSPTGKKYIGLSFNRPSAEESTVASDYSWSQITGDSVKGDKGDDGVTHYTWVRYSNNSDGTDFNADPTDKYYIGIAANSTSSTAPTSKSAYTWSLFRKDGITYYTWIKYSQYANGKTTSGTTSMSDSPDGMKYIGIAVNKTTQTEGNDPTAYTWSQILGDAVDGQSAYIWIKYSDVAAPTSSSQMFDEPGNHPYIGLAYNKTVPESEGGTAANNPSNYQWSQFRGSDGTDGVGIASIKEQYYLSTSNTTRVNGTWVDTCPPWVSGKYIWTRSYITWDDNTTSTTSPVLATGLNTANSTANTANNTANQAQSGLTTLTNGLAAGSTSIHGAAIKTGAIVSVTYNGGDKYPITNTAGSILRIDDGTFNFGGGKLKFNGSTLSVEGDITATSGKIGGFYINASAPKLLFATCTTSKKLTQYKTGLQAGASSSTKILFTAKRTRDSAAMSYGSWTYPFYIRQDGYMHSSSGDIGGVKIGTTGLYRYDNTSENDSAYKFKISTFNNNKSAEQQPAIEVSKKNSSNKWISQFKVSYSGKLTAINASIQGEVNASSGKIGGFTITSDYLSSGGANGLATKNNTVYLSNQGISLGKNFKVTKTGALTANSGSIGGFNITSSSLATVTDFSDQSESSIVLSKKVFSRKISYLDKTNLLFAIGDRFAVARTGALYCGVMNVLDQIKLRTWNQDTIEIAESGYIVHTEPDYYQLTLTGYGFQFGKRDHKSKNDEQHVPDVSVCSSFDFSTSQLYIRHDKEIFINTPKIKVQSSKTGIKTGLSKTITYKTGHTMTFVKGLLVEVT